MGILISKKKLLCEFVDYICQECKNKFTFSDLRIHRINRKWKGGTYEDFRNLKVVCKNCHKLYHANEFTHISQ